MRICKKHGELSEKDLIKKGYSEKGIQLFRCRYCHAISREKFNLNNYEKRIKSHRKSRFKNYDTKIRWATIYKKFGITKDQFEHLLKSQNNVCAICKKPENLLSKTGRGRTEYLSIDHCHDTGKIRGLLCRRCNSGIGQFKESLEIIESAVTYLKSNL